MRSLWWRPRERRILALRYFRDKSQQQIAQEVGVTQIQLSRLITKTRARLRQAIEGDPGHRWEP